MKHTLKKLTAGLLLLTLSGGAFANNLFTLENLERERASLLQTLTDSALTQHDRELQTESVYRRIIDAERMVMRDERITNSSSVLAKKAFDNYDLTFLVHASAESDKPILDHYLGELNLTPRDIQNTRVGFK